MALYRLAQLAAKRWPTNIALRSQTEALTLTFGELEQRAGATASVLSSSGLEAGQVLISDLQNTSQNLVVQLMSVAHFQPLDLLILIVLIANFLSVLKPRRI